MKDETTELILGASLGNIKNVPKYGVIHCSDVSYRTQLDQFDNVNNFHRDVKKFPISSLGLYVGYQIFITGNRTTNKWSAIRCRADDDVGAHCNQGFDGLKVYPPATPGKLSMNYQSIGICVGFDGDIEHMPPEAYAVLQKEVRTIQDKYNISNDNIFFHRKFATDKSCPGSLITPQWLKDLLLRPAPVPLDPKENRCEIEQATIVELNKKVAWYQGLVELLKSIISPFN